MPKVVEYKKGEIVYLEDSFEMAMYLIKKGAVSVIINYGKDTEMLLKNQTEGQYFGHLELIEAIPRSATIIAKEDAVLERIEGDEFGSYLSQHPEENMVILTQMSARLREIGNELHEVYHTIDEYISLDKESHDESFFDRLARIIKLGKGSK
ncbi:MAG: cyclic nucleotide-binding domain-containing protein [Spirochaetales bacterium]|nr:cyclic nucleotide-binding domain-containing protein [Spirochaetales bacterium]